MIVTEFIPPGYPQIILGPASDTPTRSRDHRPHLTDILRDMAATAGIGKNDGSGFDESDLDWFAAGGWMFERVFDMAHRDATARGDIVSPGEFECDGIVGTPDRIDWGVPKIIETKVRWKSANSFESLEKNYWIELAQVAGYCWMTKIVEADLIVFFIAGIWRPPTPRLRAAHLIFTELELEEKWQQIVRHGKSRGWL